MQSLFFWNSWIKDYRIIWYGLLTTFIAALALMWYFYLQAPEGAMQWQKLQEQKTIETTIHNFRVGPFHLTVPAESYVIFEYFSGSDVQHNMFATNCFLVILCISVVVLLSLISVLERFWYFIGMSLFIMLIMALRFDVLKIFGFRHLGVSITILGIYLLVSFYFKYFKTHSSFIIRLASFSAITLLLVGIIHFFAQVDHPALHLMITAFTPGLILTILFVLIVSHEIMVSFVYITDRGGAGNSAKHFSLISLFYLVNVIIAALHEIGVIDWNFLYLNVFLLLTISAVLAIWGFKVREPQYENILPFSPFGAFLIISLGSIALITVAQFLGNANDAVLKVVRDVIIFSHAGFGIIFFIYFVSNFMAMMGDGLPVYHLLYKPNRMPYFSFQFAGLIATLAFIFYSNWREYVYHSTAGFYNYVGDLYLEQGDEIFGISFYEQSRSRAFQNNRANYALGNLKAGRLDFEGAMRNYELSNAKRPTEFSLVNQGNLSLWTARYFDAIKYFNKAMLRAPESAKLSNNLGFAYAKVHAIDSANYFLSQARDDKETRASAEGNFLAMAALEYIPVNADSVTKLFDDESPAVAANAVALSTLLRQPITLSADPLAHKELDLHSATYLNNYIIHHVKDLDSAFIKKAYAIATDTINSSYSEALRGSLAYAYYHQGQVFKALEILGELAYITQEYGGKFNYTMGLWALEQNAPELAATYFAFADEANYKEGKFYYAIALTESRQINEALMAWDSVAAQNDVASQRFAEQLIRILNLNIDQALKLSDGEKYQFSRYKLRLSDSASFNRVVESFENVNYKAQSLLDRTNALLKADQLIAAIKTFNRISGLELTDKRLYESIAFTELRMLAIRKEVRPLAQQINKGVNFDRARNLDKVLYTALLNASSGNTKEAAAQFEYLSKSNPFFEEAILSSAEFFRTQDARSGKPYDILVNSIYVNPKSIRLLKAYAEEASRQGFDEYATSARERVAEMMRNVY
jgi:hypothetical protein